MPIVIYVYYYMMRKMFVFFSNWRIGGLKLRGLLPSGPPGVLISLIINLALTTSRARAGIRYVLSVYIH